jgi:hypothetical protein
VRKRYLAKFALVVLAVILATAVAGLYFQGGVSEELTHEVHAEMETVAELEADGMSQWVEEYEQTARMLSEFEAMQTGGAAADDQLDHELEQLPDVVTAIHYVDLSSGTVESSTSDAMEGTSLDALSLKWAQGSLDFETASETAVSEGYLNDGGERVAFVSPIEGTDKAVMVATDATERAEYFRDPIEGSYTQVVASSGTIEFAEDSSQVLTEYPGRSRIEHSAGRACRCRSRRQRRDRRSRRLRAGRRNRLGRRLPCTTGERLRPPPGRHPGLRDPHRHRVGRIPVHRAHDRSQHGTCP